jgi:hypothetical protein
LSPACLTQTLQKIPNLSGYDFEISETSCDLIAKDDAVSILVSKSGRKQQTLLFKYDPWGVATDFPPAITFVDPHTIKISIARVSSLFSRRDQWDGLNIVYDIGVIDYP